jgi:hypothetical protein
MDNPPLSSTHPGEGGSLHSENLMSLSEEERNPRHEKTNVSPSEQSKYSYAIIRIYCKFLYTWCNILVCDCAGNVPTAELGNRRKIRYIETMQSVIIKKIYL